MKPICQNDNLWDVQLYDIITGDKNRMAIIVCKRVSGKIAFLLISEELSLAWQFACPEPGKLTSISSYSDGGWALLNLLHETKSFDNKSDKLK